MNRKSWSQSLVVAALAAFSTTSCNQDEAQCESDGDCAYGQVCVYGTCYTSSDGDGDADADSDADGDADLCRASCDAAFSRCGIAEVYRQPCLDDCEARRAAQPADCIDEFDAGLACQGSESSWMCDKAGYAIPVGCEDERLAQEGCIWNGDHCADMGGLTTSTGACFVECTSDADCPLSVLNCPAAGSVWRVAYCAVRPEYQDALGCGPEGWRRNDYGGCDLVCSAEGNDFECPPQMHCVADSIVEGYFFCTGV